MENLTWGSDPEFMLFNQDENRMVSAIPILKNNKHRPIDLGDGIRAYADNVLVEASFPPQNSKTDIINTLGEVLCRIQEKLNKLGNFKLVSQSAHYYDNDQLQDSAALEVGCSSNYDAYGECVNPSYPFKDGLRSGSFHIHLGNDKLRDFDIRHQAIRILDIFLGVPSVIFDKDKTSNTRRQLYGKAGEFRPTNYGLEYRVLGNYALRSPKLTDLVFDLVNHAMGHVENNTQLNVIKSFDPEMIKHTINKSDIKLARSIMKKTDLPKKLIDRIEKKYNTDMYKAWKI